MEAQLLGERHAPNVFLESPAAIDRFARMLIRIIRRLPAPTIDGFDVRRFELNRQYEVDASLGRYLVIAGFAERLRDGAGDVARPRLSLKNGRRRENESCEHCGSGLVRPHLALGLAIPTTAEFVCRQCQRAYRRDRNTLALARVVF